VEPHFGEARSATVAVRTGDPDVARAVCGEHLYPRSMRLLRPGARLHARFAFLHLGSLTVADVRYGAEVAGVTGELGSYHLNVARSGRFWAGQDGRPLTGGPGRVAVYRPVGETELHYASADCRLLALKIDRRALEAQLSALLDDGTVRGVVRLSGQVDLDHAAGRTCVALAGLLGAEIGNATSLFYQPIFAAPVEESLIAAVLLATDHQYRDRLGALPYFGYAPRSISAAIDAVHADPRRPYTVGLLADLAGISRGRLCAEFDRRFGMAPMAYVREVRLVAAHAELVEGDPGGTSVIAVAHRWGFARLEQFVACYRARFQVSPAVTLWQRRRC
jgi:AraC-like DNA-binding protein